MGELWGIIVAAQGLVWFEAVLVVIGVSLQFVEEVVGEPVWGIPRVSNAHFLILPVRAAFSKETIVLDVVDDF